MKENEIIRFLDHNYQEEDITNTLNLLAEREIIFKKDDFYLLHNDPVFTDQRKRGNLQAEKQLIIAGRIAGMLSGFPYVRGVMVSGSLSKGISNKNSDIDFFIITAKNRLWIARTLMHVFKKAAATAGRKHFYCMNYYVDETALEIREKNIFTAMEVATALPFRGGPVYRDFLNANEWVKDYFPFIQTETAITKKTESGFLKRIAEKLFNNRLGDWLDDNLMKITVKRWKKKTEKNKMNYAGELMGMDAGKNYSKPDPHHLQQKILQRFRLKKEELEYILEEKFYNTKSFVSAEK